MALQIKSQGRGTARFQISGIQDSLYRAYSLVARRRRMSLNALLQEAVEEYMTTRHEETWRACKEPENTDEEILAWIEVPVPHHELDAEIERRALLKAREIVGGGSAASTGRRSVSQPQPPSNIRDDNQTSTSHTSTSKEPYQRKPWNPIVKWPGPGPEGSPLGDEWAAAGKPDYPEWAAMQKAKKEAAGREE